MLAWVMNLGFAASDAAGPTGPAAVLSTFILIGTLLPLVVTLG